MRGPGMRRPPLASGGAAWRRAGVALAALALAGAAQGAAAATRQVPSQAHPTLQSCADGALSGDTCEIKAGTVRAVELRAPPPPPSLD